MLRAENDRCLNHKGIKGFREGAGKGTLRLLNDGTDSTGNQLPAAPVPQVLMKRGIVLPWKEDTFEDQKRETKLIVMCEGDETGFKMQTWEG